MNKHLSFAILLWCACERTTVPAPDFHFTAARVSVCAGIATSVTVEIDDPTGVTAKWVYAGHETSAIMQDREVLVPPSLPDGIYTLVLQKADSYAQAANVLTVLNSPTADYISPTFCRGAQGAQSVWVSGGGLGGAAITINDIPAGTFPKGQGYFPLPDEIPVGGPYTVKLTNTNNCSLELRDALTVAAKPPKFAIASVSPRLGDDDNSLSIASAIRMRLTPNEPGGALNPTDKVQMNGIEASAVSATSGPSGSLDVTFDPLTQDMATDAVIRVGPFDCSETAELFAPLQTPELGFAFFGTNPTHMAATDGFILDLRGTFPISPDEILLPANAAKYTLGIDINPDPFVDEWQPMRLLYGLGKGFDAQDMQALRVIFTPSGPFTEPSEPFTASIRITRTDTSRSFVFENAVTLQPSGNIPRILMKSVDWIDAYRDGQHFEVYGCHFQDATFALVSSAGTSTPLPVSNVTTGDAFTQGNFNCAIGQPASERVTLTVSSAVSPGVYRLRASVPSGAVYEDSYPLVAYSTSASLGAFSDVARLSVGRRNPQSVVAYDRLGRKYLYVVGGDDLDDLDPTYVDAYNQIQTYEVVPVERDHSLGAIEAAHASSGLTYSYGEALVADGGNIYGLGGSTGGGVATTQAPISHARVADPLATSGEPYGTLTPFVKAAVGLSFQRYGLQSQLVVDGANRKIVTTGGSFVDGTASPVSVSDITIVNPITGDVTSSAAGPGVPAGTGNQAFQALIATRGLSSDQLWSFGGIHSLNNPTASTGPITRIEGYFSWNIPGGLTANPEFTAASGPPGIDYGVVQVGRQLFFLGGTYYVHLRSSIWFGLITRTVTAFMITDLSPSAATRTLSPLPRGQTLFSTVHLPPTLVTIGGVACSDASTTDEDCGGTLLVANPHVSASTIAP